MQQIVHYLITYSNGPFKDLLSSGCSFDVFQAVSDAYRVLGDTDRRKVYDQHGHDDALAGMPKVEPTGVLFCCFIFPSSRCMFFRSCFCCLVAHCYDRLRYPVIASFPQMASRDWDAPWLHHL